VGPRAPEIPQLYLLTHRDQARRNLPTIQVCLKHPSMTTWIAHGAISSTNIFGALNVTRAVLPYFRAQKSGTVVWIGSIGGWRGGANAGLYSATKFAVRGQLSVY
jgi:short chain dehydrogenase